MDQKAALGSNNMQTIIMSDYNVIQVLYKAGSHDAIFIIRFFCTIMQNQRDNLRISDFERSCI